MKCGNIKKMMIKRIEKFISEREKEIIKFCQKLVQIPSQNGIDLEREIVKFISQKLKEFKIKHKVVGSIKRPSILAEIGKGKRILILNAHLDTVSAGEKKFWKFDPFSGKIFKGKLYGRGSADCKAGISASIFAAYCLKKLNLLKGKLILAFDADEESGNFTGMKELLKNGLKGDFCLICHPGNEELMIGARGVLRAKLITFGKAVHTGSRYKKGINAIYRMTKIIQILERLKLKHKKDKFFPFGPKLTLSLIKGGSQINIVPDLCEIEIDIRTLPSQKEKRILKQIKEALQKKINFKFFLQSFLFWPAYRISENSKLVKLILKRAKEILKRKPKISCAGASNVGNLLWQHKIKSISGFGVDFENAHSYNECISLKSLIEITILYAHLAFDFLKEN